MGIARQFINAPAITQIRFKTRWLFAVGLILFGQLFFGTIDGNSMPDYQSYMDLYFNNNPVADYWEPFFIGILRSAAYFELNYPVFRGALFSVSALLFIYSFNSIRRNASASPQSIRNSLILTSSLWVMFALIFSEYMLVRIRAGLCISLFSFSVAAFLVPKVKVKTVYGLFFGILAFLTHRSTFLVLLAMTILPVTAYFVAQTEKALRMLYHFLAFTVAVTTLAYILSEVSSRGEQLYSPLNPARFLAIAVVPLIAVFIGFCSKRYRPPPTTPKERFHFVWQLSYTYFCLVLMIFHLASLTAISGEAIVRVFGLASIPSCYSIACNTKLSKRPLEWYIILVNGLFFANSVLLQV